MVLYFATKVETGILYCCKYTDISLCSNDRPSLISK
jgi:hypothetical protein